MLFGYQAADAVTTPSVGSDRTVSGASTTVRGFDTGDTRRLQGFGTVHSCALRRIFSARIRTAILRPHRPPRSRHRISAGWRGRWEVAHDRYRPHCWRSSAGGEPRSL